VFWVAFNLSMQPPDHIRVLFRDPVRSL